MSTVPSRILHFDSSAIQDKEALLVTRMSGTERVSGLYEFELELITNHGTLDVPAILAQPAEIGLAQRVALKGGGSGTISRRIPGILRTFRRVATHEGWTHYRAVLVPRLWLLTQSHRSRTFKAEAMGDVTLSDGVVAGSSLSYVERVLQGLGLNAGEDYEFRISSSAAYPVREYVVQWQETDFDFISRWLEHEGVFYYFDYSGDREKLILADSTAAYTPMRAPDLQFQPQAPGSDDGQIGAIESWFAEEAVRQFEINYSRLQKTVKLRDYNWRTPAENLLATAVIDETGSGIQYEYNEHFKTNEEGTQLATVRAEERRQAGITVEGHGDARNMQAGYVFNLANFPDAAFNTSYFLTAVAHEAQQTFPLNSAAANGARYTNTFSCIVSNVPFRPARNTDWPAIKGVMHAKVDSRDGDEYADIDEYGRYRVELPFDDGGDGVSRWCRMAQPYVGGDYGMSFPLHKGIEVLIAHTDGDPDRPVIIGAVADTSNVSLVTSENREQNMLRSSTGNVFRMSDSSTSAGMFLGNSDRSVMERWGNSFGSSGSSSASSGSGSDSGGSSGAGASGMNSMATRTQAPSAAPSVRAAAAKLTTPWSGQSHAEADRMIMGGGDLLGLGSLVFMSTGTTSAAPTTVVVSRRGSIATGATDDVGTLSSTQTTTLAYTLTNGTASAITLQSAAVANATNCSVAVTNPGSMTGSLAAGGTKSVFVLLSPTPGQTAFSFTLQIAYVEGSTPTTYTVNVTGEGATESAISVAQSSSSLSSGSSDSIGYVAADTAFTRVYTITNSSSTLSLRVDAVATGSNTNCTASATSAETLSYEVDPGATLDVSVEITPGSGPFSSQLTITTNDFVAPAYTVTITGTGRGNLAVSTNSTSIDNGGSYSVGTQQITFGYDHDITVSHTGSSNDPDIVLSGVSVGSATECTATTDFSGSITLSASGSSGATNGNPTSTTFKVTVTASTDGAEFTAPITIASDDTVDPSYALSLTGTGGQQSVSTASTDEYSLDSLVSQFVTQANARYTDQISNIDPIVDKVYSGEIRTEADFPRAKANLGSLTLQKGKEVSIKLSGGYYGYKQGSESISKTDLSGDNKSWKFADKHYSYTAGAGASGSSGTSETKAAESKSYTHVKDITKKTYAETSDTHEEFTGITTKYTQATGAIATKVLGFSTSHAAIGAKHNAEALGVNFSEKFITIGSNDFLICPFGVVNKITLGGFHFSEKAIYTEVSLSAMGTQSKISAAGSSNAVHAGVKNSVLTGASNHIQTGPKSEVYCWGKNEVVIGNKSSVHIGKDKKVTIGLSDSVGLVNKDMSVAKKVQAALIALN